VNDMTNELLKKNADKLKTAVTESAKEAERGIVDIETLKHTNETLISTIDEVISIQQNGSARRHEAEKELNELEITLKQKLMEASKK
ncbi:MAG: toxic anion resistance protein, partial [Candidatus Weimeria sp.]